MIKTDVVIVGAGPCGLFQVFELGLLGLSAEVVDSIRQPGGQCTELYPDKPIYDIPGIPVCTGEELTANLMKQIEPFGAGMHLGDEVSVVRAQDDGFYVETDSGKQFSAKAVVIAAGVGSFQPRALRAKGLDEVDEDCVQYRVRDPQQYAGKNLAILGGGDSALDWVVELGPIAKHITLVHRRDEYRAVDATVAAMRDLEAAGKVTTIENAKVSELQHDDGVLTGMTVGNKSKETFQVDVEQMLVFFGLAPKLGPIAEWGLDINRKTINVDTERFETSTPGIYAIGDINHYPGKKKLILCGFHEAALAAFAIKQRIEPDKKVHVQYTTTSPVMHKRLGINEGEE
ncbi:MAG: NAD(P)-binding domain-containing protein [Gammaproteobacteria bacterium]|nr:NAD(P)-binding domain-containing protein [Gammaproteobacteria bacterium]